MKKLKHAERIELTEAEWDFVNQEAAITHGSTGKYLSALISTALRFQNPQHRIYTDDVPNGSTFGKAVNF